MNLLLYYGFQFMYDITKYRTCILRQEHVSQTGTVSEAEIFCL